MKKPRTHLEARAWISEQGISIAQWSRQEGFNEDLVRTVLEERRKCAFGTSHNIAVALGMKAGVRTDQPGRGARTSHAAAGAAA